MDGLRRAIRARRLSLDRWRSHDVPPTKHRGSGRGHTSARAAWWWPSSLQRGQRRHGRTHVARRMPPCRRAPSNANCVASSGHYGVEAYDEKQIPQRAHGHAAVRTARRAPEPSTKGACDEPHRKDSDDGGDNEVLSAEDQLCQVLSAAHGERGRRHREPNDRADDGSLRQGWDSAYRSDVFEEPQHQHVVNGTQASVSNPNTTNKGNHASAGGQWLDVEIGMVSQHEPGARDGRAAENSAGRTVLTLKRLV